MYGLRLTGLGIVALFLLAACDLTEDGRQVFGTLTVERSGEGVVRSEPDGIDCGDDCTLQVPLGTNVALSADPASGWEFSAWSGGCAGTEPTCQLEVANDAAVTATFLPIDGVADGGNGGGPGDDGNGGQDPGGDPSDGGDGEQDSGGPGGGPSDLGDPGDDSDTDTVRVLAAYGRSLGSVGDRAGDYGFFAQVLALSGADLIVGAPYGESEVAGNGACFFGREGVHRGEVARMPVPPGATERPAEGSWKDTGPAPGIAAVFAALGDPTRTALLTRLAAEGRGTATSLTAVTNVTRQAVDRHLRVLANAGLVESRREGREVVYSLRTRTLEQSAAWLEELGRAWERRLQTVKAAAEAPEEDR